MNKKSRQYQKLLGMMIAAAILLIGITACSGKTARTTGETNSTVTEETETVVFQAVVLEIQDSSYLVEPVEGSPELKSADQIVVSISGAEPSPEPEAGDIIEITYDGMIAETYPAQISHVYSIRVVKKTSGS
ncbi:MAG: hypothetical protein LUE86_02435 [Clostridiales bacterium]|nr:hypothetical protein [Clostridiales bacterium]